MLKESPILVTGATGYIGGRLVPRLLDAGYRVRCLVRDTNRLQGRSWLGQVEVVSGDAHIAGTLTEAMQGVSVAYYLIHGKQGGNGSFISVSWLTPHQSFRLICGPVMRLVIFFATAMCLLQNFVQA